MSETWPLVRLGDVLRRSDQAIAASPDAEYREITVKLWGKGVVLRGVVSGGSLAGSRRFVAKSGQFIVSRIDARNGAMGVVPPSLDGAVVTNDFPLFDVDPERFDPEYLGWLSKTPRFVSLCQRASEGTTNRVRLKEDQFLGLELRIPALDEQRRIATRIGELVGKLSEARQLHEEVRCTQERLLLSAFHAIADGVPRLPMQAVASLVRRMVKVRSDTLYPELGIRSFGRGTFHKPALAAADVGTKRLFEIHPGDLVFSNVFAWEGAVAVARAEDAGRYGSHRFITCVPDPDVVMPRFLWFYFLTSEGLEQLQAASPGGAGRNRTLGLSALASIPVPVPSLEKQRWFDRLQLHLERAASQRTVVDMEIDGLHASILNRAFSGEF